MGDITHDSHYVPQATLRRWSDDGTHVFAYRILVSHPNVPEWVEQSIRSVTRQADLYTTLEGDEESDRVERHITRVYEEPGQAAIERLLGDPGQRRRIEAAARQRVEREFGWDTIARRQARLYRDLIG